MKPHAFFAIVMIALACRSAGAAAETAAQPYRIGLPSTGGEAVEQEPFATGLIRGFSRYGLVLGQNLYFERRDLAGNQLLDEPRQTIKIAICARRSKSLGARTREIQ